MMNSLIACLLISTAAGMVLYSESADACQPPPALMLADHGSVDDPLEFTDSVIALRVDVNASDWGADDSAGLNAVVVTPVDDPEAVIDGEWELREISEIAGGTFLVWTPDSELPEGLYQLSLDVEWGWQDSAVFRHKSGVEAAAELGGLTLEMYERPSAERNCCDIAGCETVGFDCGYDGDFSCQSCWAVRYEYLPRLTGVIAHETGSYMLHVYRSTDVGTEHHVRSVSLSRRLTDAVALFDEGMQGPYCLRVELERMSDGAIVSDSGSMCASADEMPAYERRQPDNRSAMEQCDTLPEDPDDPNWVEFEEDYDTDELPPHGTDTIEDYEPRPRRGKRGPDLGCSSAGPASAPTLPLAVLLGLALIVFRARRRSVGV